MKTRYHGRLVEQGRLSGAPGGRMPAELLGALINGMFQGNLRALRLRLEGRSHRPGQPPQWLQEAASFDLVGISAGSIVLDLEAPPLRELLPPGLLGLLDPSFADRPSAALFAESMAATVTGEGPGVLYDDGIVEALISLSEIFTSGFEELEIRFDDFAASLRREHVERLHKAQEELRAAATPNVALTGTLIGVDSGRRSYVLRLDEGRSINGFADDVLIEQLPPLFGRRVAIKGRGVTVHGRLERLVAESIEPATEAPLGPGSEPGTTGRLARLTLRGLKSIRDLPAMPIGPTNVLIGANGAGKSNLISCFRLLEALASAGGALPTYVTGSGGASALLHDSAAKTQEIGCELLFETEAGSIEYAFRLRYGAPDTLLFAEEKYRSSASGAEGAWVSLGAGHRESGLHRADDTVARAILGLVRRSVTYQLHNTSETARIRQRWAVGDGLALKTDGGNLAPFLLRLRDSRPDAYVRITDTIRQIAPFFADFVLEPEQGTVILMWRERSTDVVFQPHQASDGMLRMMALVALLLQPYEDLPVLIIVDEPELGLHPYAINIIAGLFRSASLHAQVILATQSTTFLDLFEPQEIIVVDRPGRESRVRRLDPQALASWLEEYSVGELWEKNVFGGRPAR